MHFGTTSRLRHYIADLKAIQIEMPVAWAEVDIRELQYPILEAEVRILRLTCFRQIRSSSAKVVLACRYNDRELLGRGIFRLLPLRVRTAKSIRLNSCGPCKLCAVGHSVDLMEVRDPRQQS